LRTDGVAEMWLVNTSHGSAELAEDARCVGRELLKGEGGRILLDCTGLRTSDARSRRFQPFPDTQRIAFYVPDHVSRWVVRAFLAISRPAFPTRVFREKADANEWLEA
jgi:hypothetical protein